MLAIAECQLMMMSTDPTPSRAGSLPQLFWGDLRMCIRHRSLVGASLLAIAECQLMMMSTDPTLSRAGSLPQLFLGGLKICIRHKSLVARELAPAGVRSRPRRFFRPTASAGFATAAQPSGSKRPRHRAVVWLDSGADQSANNTAASKPTRKLPQWRPPKKNGTSISVMISPVSRR